MPGLRLTEPQVQRLCGVDPAMAASALRALVSAGFLQALDDGSYGRTDLQGGSQADGARAVSRAYRRMRVAAADRRTGAPRTRRGTRYAGSAAVGRD